MTGAILVRWGVGFPGREGKLLEVFAKVMARFEELANQGRIHSHREFFTITGPDGGFMIVEGEVDELLRILAEDETLRLNAQAGATVEDFDIQVFAGGDLKAMEQVVGNYVSGMQELGYL